MSGHLLRGHAPISEAGWKLIDEEARDRLTPGLAARRLVDFDGPKGWAHSATNLGRVADDEISPLDHVEGRGPPRPAAGRTACAFHGLARRAGRGRPRRRRRRLRRLRRRPPSASSSPRTPRSSTAGRRRGSTASRGSPRTTPIPCGDVIDRWPSHVARAVETLLRNGVSGPYGLALGREEYTRVIETAEHGGHLLFDHLRKILGGPIVWAPGVDGGVVLSPPRRGLPVRLRSGHLRGLRVARCRCGDVVLGGVLLVPRGVAGGGGRDRALRRLGVGVREWLVGRRSATSPPRSGGVGCWVSVLWRGSGFCLCGHRTGRRLDGDVTDRRFALTRSRRVRVLRALCRSCDGAVTKR